MNQMDLDFQLGAAAIKGDITKVKHLHENGADIHYCNDYAVRVASENGNLEVVKYLHENGANIHAHSDYAINWASRNGYEHVVRYLKKHGAKLKLTDGQITFRCILAVVTSFLILCGFVLYATDSQREYIENCIESGGEVISTHSVIHCVKKTRGGE